MAQKRVCAFIRYFVVRFFSFFRAFADALRRRQKANIAKNDEYVEQSKREGAFESEKRIR
jgi:hypothetical protein